MITRILLILFLLLTANASAATKYFRQGATGSGSGDDWTNAYTNTGDSATFNSRITRGDTVYFADGTYNGWPAFTFNKPASGTTLITVKKAIPGSGNHGTDTGWSDSFGDGQAIFNGGLKISSAYWIFDGQTGGGPGSWTSNYGFKVDASAVLGPSVTTRDGGANLTIRHMEVKGCYSQGAAVNLGHNADTLNIWDGSGSSCTFSYMWLYDAARCPIFNSGNNITFEYIYTGRFGLSNAGHSEIMSSQRDPDPGGGPDNITVRWCLFTSAASTGGLLTKGTNYYIYGNVFIQRENRTMPHGFSGKWDQKRLHGCWSWNNSYLSPTAISPFFNYSINSQGSTSSDIMIHNSILYDDAAWSNGNFSNVNAHNYNHFAAISPSGVFGEANGSNSPTNPFVNIAGDDFGLTAAQAAAIPPGQNLTGVAPYNSRPGYNMDMFGNVRGADNKWDRGAIEFVSGAPVDPLPTVSSVVIAPAGNQATLTFSEAIQFGAGGSGGFSLVMSGGTVPLSSPSGSGSTRTFSTNRVIAAGEGGTLSYVQPGNGAEDTAGQDMLSASGIAVTNNSSVQQATTPSFNPAAGPYFGTQNVAISSTPGVIIRYTTDGTDPTASSTEYISGQPVPVSLTTTIKAKAFALSGLHSAISTASYEIGTWATTGTWKTFVVPPQTSAFTWRFRARTSLAASDTVVGLSPQAVGTWDHMPVTLRFATNGRIDAINSGTYAAVTPFTYSANTDYEFVVTVDFASKSYNATVAPVGGTPVTTIASGYAFRTQQANASEVDNVGMFGLTGNITVSQMSFGGVTAANPNLVSATINASGTRLTLGFDIPVSIGTGGNGGWAINPSGGPATLAFASYSGNNLVYNITGRAISIGESGTVSYTQPTNGVEAVSGGGDLATLSGFAFANGSTVDLVPPVPSPMTFSSNPNAGDPFSITMTATEATDPYSSPVQYSFVEMSGNPGATNSGWRPERSYTDSGLNPGTAYQYRVQARDAAGNLTSFSSIITASTPIISGARAINPTNGIAAGIITP